MTQRAGEPARVARIRKPKEPLCNCPATRELYGKAFPHRPGKVKGCHMQGDGQAKDGIARPGCHCKACDLTNTRNTWAGDGSRAMEQEQFSTAAPLWPAWMGKDLETALEAHQNHVGGV